MRDLPHGWALSTLGEIGDYLNGRGFRKHEWSDRGRPIIRIQNLTGSSHHFNHFDGAAEERYIARDGDLLVSWAATLGVFVWRGSEAVVNQHIFKVESRIDQPFHRYLLLSVLGALQRQTHGSGMVHITKSRFGETPVALPPLPEQGRIVAAIEEHLSRLDAAEASLVAAKSRSFVLEQASLRAAFEGGWARVPVSEATSNVTDGTHAPPPREETGLPLLSAKDVTAGGTIEASSPRFASEAYVLSELERTGLTEDDVLLTIVGTIGRSAVVPPSPTFALQRSVAILKPTGVLSKFLSFFLRSPQAFRFYAEHERGTAQKGLYLGHLRQLPVPMPPLDEQNRIVARIEERLSAIDTLRAAIERAQRRSASLRRAVLERAFRGELVPQDPDDEPASVLLERIAAERAAAPKPTRKRREKASA